MNYDCVCYGEILFDVLPTEIKAGGAPMNVAYHLNKLGKRSTLISRVGEDKRGEDLIEFLKNRNIDTTNVQVDKEHATSVVIASPNEAGDMKYEIVENVAWDFIELKPDCEMLLKNSGYFVFGSLATRSAVSRNTLFSLLEVDCKKVFDINLRAPFIHKENIEYQLRKADILKMNEEELDLVSGWYADYNSIEEKINFLQDKFHLNTLIVTRGAKGAVVNRDGSFFKHAGFKVKVADTIGSGDSFLAGFLSSLLNKKSIADALDFACSLGAFVATQAGGCPDYKRDDIEKFDPSLTF